MEQVQIIRAPAPHVHLWSDWRTEPDSRPGDPQYRVCYGCGERQREDEVAMMVEAVFAREMARRRVI